MSPGGINVVYNFTYSAFVYALKCILDPHTPYNEGITRAVKVRVPPRTHPQRREFPAPVFARNQTAHYLPALVMAAIAKAAPERVMAACGSPTNRTVFAGPAWPRRQAVLVHDDLERRHGRVHRQGRAFVHAVSVELGLAARGSARKRRAAARAAARRCAWTRAARARSAAGWASSSSSKTPPAKRCSVASRMDRVTNPPEGLAGGHPGALAGIWHERNQAFSAEGQRPACARGDAGDPLTRRRRLR